MTRRLRVTSTDTLLVDVPDEEAEMVLDCDDGLTRIEAAARYRRQAHYASEFIEGDVEVTAADGEVPWYSAVLDSSAATPGYLWSARHFVIAARHQLDMGRYREGHCPDLDEVNGQLARLEDRLRLMALAADPRTAALAEQERART